MYHYSYNTLWQDYNYNLVVKAPKLYNNTYTHLVLSSKGGNSFSSLQDISSSYHFLCTVKEKKLIGGRFEDDSSLTLTYVINKDLKNFYSLNTKNYP